MHPQLDATALHAPRNPITIDVRRGILLLGCWRVHTKASVPFVSSCLECRRNPSRGTIELESCTNSSVMSWEHRIYLRSKSSHVNDDRKPSHRCANQEFLEKSSGVWGGGHSLTRYEGREERVSNEEDLGAK